MCVGVGGSGGGGGRDCRPSVTLTVSLHAVVLGCLPALRGYRGGGPIQSAVMESKVIVHSCKIAVANCLSQKH